ncbi:ABC transporter substrate binding protein [Pseudodesulfovibrio sp. zrk46]|uniref:ABC transporter substrate binding protein n=1 Tax=Pseudodesulfovibrio sp. zrk46 TaxID=2725288 RepID=UPI001449CB10|nr:ABC transporter substrate binding protein [Pseudodesulfovibrio sp. zrk46]QJB55956.1 PAS domain S-box protein [Pseudodesulfovibrio sp. zrk46]
MRKILAALILIFCLATVTSAVEDKRVLFISSYHPGFPTFFDQVLGLKNVLDEHDVLLDVEFMDTKRFFTQQNYANFTRLLKLKLENSPPYDALVVADDNALNYAILHRNDMFSGLPVVFLGINNEQTGKVAAQDFGWTGVLEAVSMEQTVGLMRHLLPDMRNVVVITDATTTGQSDLKYFKSRMTLRGDNKYEIIDLSKISWKELPALLRAIPRSDSILLLAPYRDKDGITKTFPEGLAVIRDNAVSPIFHLWKHGMGDGILGGKIVSFKEHGRLAGGLVLKILEGVAPASLPIIPGKDANVVTLDWDELVRFQIPEERLPKNSVLLNYTPSFVEKNRTVVLQLGGLILFLILVISYLLKLNRSRVLAEASAQDNWDQYRAYMESSPVGIIAFDNKGAILDTNKAMNEMSAYSPMQLENMSVLDLLSDKDRRIAQNGLDILIRESSRKESYEIVRGDGRSALVRFSGNRLENGTMLAFCQDITDETKTHSDQNRIENLFRGLLEQSCSLSFVTSKDGSMLFVNTKACDTLGYSRAEFMVLKLWNLDPTTKSEEARDERWTRDTVETETFLHRKDGSLLPVLMRTSMVSIGPDEDALLIAAQDLTEQYEELQCEKRLQDSTYAYADIISTLAEPRPSTQDAARKVHYWAKKLTNSEFSYLGAIESLERGMQFLELSDFGEKCSIDVSEFVFKKQDGKFPALWGESLNTGKPVLTNEANAHPAARGLPEGHVHIARFLSVPCMYEGEILGQIGLANADHDYTADDQLIVENLASLYALAIYQDRMEKDLEQARQERLKKA